MAVPAAALRYASSRHGIVTAMVLRESGLSLRQVRRLVDGHQLEELHRGVFRVAGAPVSWEQRQLGACLATGGVASHRAALRLWEPPWSAKPAECPLEVTVDLERAPRPAGVVVHRTTVVDRKGSAVRQGITVTSPLRMMVDLGAVVEEAEVMRALERLVISRLITVEGVRRELERTAAPGRRGVRAARAAVEEWPMGDVRPDSKLEVEFARLLRGSDLPPPRYQHEVKVGGRRRFLDAAYPEIRLAIELDGFGAHADRVAFRDDRRRHNDLIEAGWVVLHFTLDDVIHRPDYVLATIRSRLAAAQVGTSV